MLLKMDSTHLITHKDTSATIKRTHTFLIINIIAMVIIVGGSLGWLIYAHSSKKWPYDPYVRKSGPHGTVKYSDYLKNHPTNKTTGGTSATGTDATAATGGTGTATGTG